MLHRVTFAANWESSQESGSRAVGMSRASLALGIIPILNPQSPTKNSGG
jgi:hypothetical protein